MQLVKIKILSKQKEITTKDGKTRKIRDWWTNANIVVAGEESKGRQRKSITVKFTQDVQLPKDVHYAIIEGVLGEQLGLPTKYEVTTDKDGKKVYPTVWVRGYKTLTPVKPKVDLSTVEYLLDEDIDDEEETELEENADAE